MSFPHLTSDSPDVPRRTGLAALRERIRTIEQPARHGVLPFGVAAIDEVLPNGGLAIGAVHEILGIGADEEDGAAACGFIATLLARLGPHPLPAHSDDRAIGSTLSPLKGGEGNRLNHGGFNPLTAPVNRKTGDGKGREMPGEGIVLWCLKRPDLYGPGLIAHGLDPARLVVVAAPRDEDILWAVEEGLRTPGLAAVVGEIGRLPMVTGRRLQLAAEHSGVTAFLLRRWRNGAEAAAERERPSVAMTRWRIAALSAIEIEDPRLRQVIGKPRWRVELLRCRGGMPAQWEIEFGNMELADATGYVRLSAALANRPAAAQRRSPEPLQRAG